MNVNTLIICDESRNDFVSGIYAMFAIAVTEPEGYEVESFDLEANEDILGRKRGFEATVDGVLVNRVRFAIAYQTATSSGLVDLPEHINEPLKFTLAQARVVLRLAVATERGRT